MPPFNVLCQHSAIKKLYELTVTLIGCFHGHEKARQVIRKLPLRLPSGADNVAESCWAGPSWVRELTATKGAPDWPLGDLLTRAPRALAVLVPERQLLLPISQSRSCKLYTKL